MRYLSGDELIAWDRFVAAGISNDDQIGTALSQADKLIAERRKRTDPCNDGGYEEDLNRRQEARD
jgi:hypothetical protein